jgi:hypothetical protein
MNNPITYEDAGQRRKPGQSLNDRLRDIKDEPGWFDVADTEKLREHCWTGEEG